MDNFKAIYMILDGLEKAMDSIEVDVDFISPEKLDISQNRWANIMVMLADSGYIKGISGMKILINKVDMHREIFPEDLQITLKGLEYLKENNQMQKIGVALKTAVGFVSSVAGVI